MDVNGMAHAPVWLQEVMSRIWRSYWSAPLSPDRAPLVNFSEDRTWSYIRKKEKRLRRNYTREFKLDVVRQVATGHKRPTQLSVGSTDQP